MNLEASVYPPMLPTRPCAFCLSLRGGSVFADFGVDHRGRAYLVRISFDGYGCCQPGWRTRLGRMSKSDTELLLAAVESDEVDTPAIARILRTYFSQNRDLLWPDALADHELLPSEPS